MRVEARGSELQRVLVAGPAPPDAAAPHPPPRHAVQSLYNSPRLPRPRTVNYIANIYSQIYNPSRALLYSSTVRSRIVFELSSAPGVTRFIPNRRLPVPITTLHRMHYCYTVCLPILFLHLGVATSSSSVTRIPQVLSYHSKYFSTTDGSYQFQILFLLTSRFHRHHAYYRQTDLPDR